MSRSRTLAESAARYAVRGWAVFPLRPRDKRPLIAAADGGKGCHDATADVATVEAWWERWPEANVGLHCGPASGVFVLDVDAEAPEVADGEPTGATGAEAVAAWEAVHGALPPTLTATTGGGGEHRYFRMPAGRSMRNRARLKTPDGRRAGLDVRAEGGYVVLPPSVHPSGAAYRWVGAVREPAEAPAWLVDLLDPPRAKREPLVVLSGMVGDHARRYGERALQLAVDAILAAPESQRHDTIYREAASIGELVGGGCLGRDQAEAALVEAGERVGKRYKEVSRTVAHAMERGMAQPRRPEERLRDGAGGSPRRRAAWEDGPPAWLDEAPPWDVAGPPPVLPPREADMVGEDTSDGEAEAGTQTATGGASSAEVDPNAEVVGEGDAPDGTEVVGDFERRMTDLGNARRLLDLEGANLRWCGAMPGSGWLVWDGARWRPDETRSITRRAVVVAEAWRADGEAIPLPDPDDNSEAANAARKRRKALLAHALRCESAGAIRNLIDLAAAHTAIERDRFDADPMLFNTPNLTLDLRRGRAFTPRREDYLTKQGGVGVIVRDTCPTWLAFLHEIMGGDVEMVGYLQRAVGYCLTGSTAEQAMFIAHGSGANGKSTFIEVVRYILGDYARNTPIETFTGRREGGIPNDLAALAGARVVTCSEPAEGAALNEGLIKLCTGDDTISARFLNREFFDYLPTFKVWMLTNHRPVVKGTDNGIWRRLQLIPFEVTIPPERRDKDLLRKLKAEAAGVLQWAVDGCGDWRSGGLRPPERVRLATEAYKDEMDVVAHFLAERTERGATLSITNARLYEAFQAWCKANGEYVRHQRWFSLQLKSKGFQQSPGRQHGRMWCGLDLVDPNVTPIRSAWAPRGEA